MKAVTVSVNVHLGNQALLARLGRFPEERTEVQLAPRQPFQCRGGDLTETLGIDISHNPRLDVWQVHSAQVHLAEEFFQKVRGEDLADNVKDSG